MGKLKSKDRTANAAPRGVAAVPPSPIDEVAGALSAEIARCAACATERALLLESISTQSFNMSTEIFQDARSDKLRQLSHRIRGLVAHALGVLAELQCVAGRLDALAALRAAESTLEPGDDCGR
jgi:hypothetical protein